MTEAAPGYSPDGRALVSSSFSGTADRLSERDVRRELARIYGVPADGWVHLHTAEVPRALPALPAACPLRRDVALGDGLFVAGDRRDTPSQQGALVSGRRAAQAVLAHLRRLTAGDAVQEARKSRARAAGVAYTRRRTRVHQRRTRGRVAASCAFSYAELRVSGTRVPRSGTRVVRSGSA